jgi:hypothetical protein
MLALVTTIVITANAFAAPASCVSSGVSQFELLSTGNPNPCWNPPFEFIAKDWGCEAPSHPSFLPPTCLAWRVTKTSCVSDNSACQVHVDYEGPVCFMGHCVIDEIAYIQAAWWLEIATPAAGEIIMFTLGEL